MSRFEFPVYATLAALAGPIMFYRGFRDLRTRRLIQNTPTARIRSMAMGLVEVHGVVLERSRIRSPFTGRECAYWEVDIAIRGRRNTGWRTVHRACSGNPFFLDDGTGIALVYPTGSQCTIPASAEEECVGFGVPDMYADYMKRAGLWQRHMWRLAPLRFRERTLEEGVEVFILGSAEPRTQSLTISDPDEEPVVQQAPGTDGAAVSAPPATGTTAAREAGPVVHPVFGGAAFQAGGIEFTRIAGTAMPAPLAAAVLGSAAAARVPRRDHGRSGPARIRSLHSQVSAVISRGRNEPTFLISAGSETSVTTALTISMFLKLVGGPLLTVFGLGYWLLALSHGPVRLP